MENKRCRGTGMGETSEKAMLPTVYKRVIFVHTAFLSFCLSCGKESMTL